MISAVIREKLRDPSYLDQHMIAAAIVRDIGKVPWYDAHFLARFEAAKRYLAMVRPDVLSEFVAGFAPLRPPAGFKVREIDRLFEPHQFAAMLEIARSIPDNRLELHEIADFGRNVVHDHEYYTQVQAQIVPLVSELAGRELEPGYNFLSLYGADGRCDPHMDEPEAMYTLDICLDQSGPWPIHFSNIVDWPDATLMQGWDPRSVLADPAITFTPYALEPNKAILFNGSSQWHYRDSIAPGGFCTLLFMHYFPKGCGDLVRPRFWARHFGWAELEPLCDIFAEAYDRTS